ncbi:MAG TPA: nuclear transport factor 2 family protein [Dokdonella sp.]
MKSHILFAIALAIMTPAAQARDTAQDEREILRVEAALCRAFETGDVATLRNGLDARFTLVDSSGKVTDLAQNLAEVESGDPAYDRFHNHGQSIRLYGDAAIVTGITSIEGRSGGQAFAADFRFTDTWVRVDGQWKMAASHATRLPPDTR